MNFWEFANDHPYAATFMVLFVCGALVEIGAMIIVAHCKEK